MLDSSYNKTAPLSDYPPQIFYACMDDTFCIIVPRALVWLFCTTIIVDRLYGGHSRVQSSVVDSHVEPAFLLPCPCFLVRTTIIWPLDFVLSRYCSTPRSRYQARDENNNRNQCPGFQQVHGYGFAQTNGGFQHIHEPSALRVPNCLFGFFAKLTRRRGSPPNPNPKKT